MKDLNKIIPIFTPYLLSLGIFLLFLMLGVFLVKKAVKLAPQQLLILKTFWKWKAKYPFFAVYSLFQLLYAAFAAMTYVSYLADFFEEKLLILGLLLIFTFQCYVWSVYKFPKINRRVNRLLISTALLLSIYALASSILSMGNFITKLVLGALIGAAFWLGLARLHRYSFRKKLVVKP